MIRMQFARCSRWLRWRQESHAGKAEDTAANGHLGRSIEAMLLWSCGAAPAAQIEAGVHEVDLMNDFVYEAIRGYSIIR
jgi:hypothetical protein